MPVVVINYDCINNVLTEQWKTQQERKTSDKLCSTPSFIKWNRPEFVSVIIQLFSLYRFLNHFFVINTTKNTVFKYLKHYFKLEQFCHLDAFLYCAHVHKHNLLSDIL